MAPANLPQGGAGYGPRDRRGNPRRFGTARDQVPKIGSRSSVSWHWTGPSGRSTERCRSPRRRATKASALFVVPAANGPEAAVVTGVEVLALQHLRQAGPLAAGSWRPAPPGRSRCERKGICQGPDLTDLRGQHRLRHALEVAAAGGHSLLMIGPPGVGKALAATRLPSILPPMSEAKRWRWRESPAPPGASGGGLEERPFRAPHCWIGAAGIGRGRQPAARRRGDDRSPRSSLSSMSSATSAAMPWRGCNPRSTRMKWSSGPRTVSGGCRAGSCWSPAQTPVPAAAAELSWAATARRLRSTATASVFPAPLATESTSSPRFASRPLPKSPVPRASLRRPFASGSPARERQAHRLGAGRCNAEMTPDEALAPVIGTDAAEALLARRFFATLADPDAQRGAHGRGPRRSGGNVR